MKKRYVRKEISDSYWVDLVVCPNCGKDAETLHDTGGYYPAGHELRCKHCGFCKKSEEMVFYKAIISFHCPDCGTPIEKEQPNLKEKWLHLKVNCPNCNAQHIVQPKYEMYREKYPEMTGMMHESSFGLPLFLQTEVKGNLFWARNLEHLLKIEDYVSSDLRERHGMEMVAKLPNFIKSAKNREAVLKAIAKLKEKLND